MANASYMHQTTIWFDASLVAVFYWKVQHIALDIWVQIMFDAYEQCLLLYERGESGAANLAHVSTCRVRDVT